MYGTLLETTPDLTEIWAETGYSRVSVDRIEPDNPVREFNEYYRSLSDHGMPRWEAFDICAVPKHVVAYIALGRPEYLNPTDEVPDHFVYTLEGGAVRSLIGRSVIGLKIGQVKRLDDSNSLRREVDDAVASRDVVCARSDLDLEDRPNLRFTRGLFLFSGADGSIEKLVVVLYKMPIGR